VARLAELNVLIGAKIEALEKGLSKAERKLKRSARKFNEMGDNMTNAITIPVAGFVGRSIQLFDRQAQAIAQVNAGLESTAASAGHSSEALQDMAAGLQDVSTYGDEEILSKVTAQLLTFTQITEERFPRAQKAILDVSARLGNDLQSSAMQVAKALNDPVANLGALTEAGIQFSDGQKEVIKSLVETNRIAEAQGIILTELENQFGGSATAAAKAGLGPIKQFNNSLGDMMETVGAAVLPSLTSFVQKITELFKRFDQLDESTKKNIIKIGLFAAAIGPALKIVGMFKTGLATAAGLIKLVTGLTKSWGVVQAAINVLLNANPIGIVITAVAALSAGIAIAHKKSQKFRAVLLGLGRVAKEVWSIIKETVQNFIAGFQSLKDGNFKQAFADFSKAMVNANPVTLALAQGKRLGNAYREGYKEEMSKIPDDVQEQAKQINKSIAKAGSSIDVSAFSSNKPASASSGGGKAKKPSEGKGLGEFTQKATEAEIIAAKLADTLRNADAAGIELDNSFKLIGSSQEKLKTNFSNLKTPMDELVQKFDVINNKGIILGSGFDVTKEKLNILKGTIIGLIEEGYSPMSSTIQNMILMQQQLQEQMVVSQEGFLSLTEMAAKLGESGKLIQKGVGAAFQDLIGLLDRGETSYKKLGQAAIQAAKKEIGAAIRVGVANAIKRALTDVPYPFNLILAGTAGIAAQALFNKAISSISIPAFAEGGLAYGPMLAIVGDNPGARTDPEVISPLSKLKDMIGNSGAPANVNLDGRFVLKGRDLLLTVEKAQQDQMRTKGV